MADGAETIRVPFVDLKGRVATALRNAGASEDSLRAATRAMMHASLVGVDSHGVRLTEHYSRVLNSGRVNPNPSIRIEQRGAGSAMINADNGLGHLAGYRAIETGIEIAREAGVAAVGVTASSHLGAAGAYAMAGADDGFITFATTNTDALVSLFDGAAPFHGTNPLALAAPVPNQRPWLLDMATSSIPWNRVLLYRSLGGRPLPDGVAADSSGAVVTDPNLVKMLLPLGGTDYGYKGAGLAGVATLLSAVLTGSTIDPEMISMSRGPDWSTPRNLGHFFIVIDPGRFAGREVYDALIVRYLDAIRNAPQAEGGTVMAPGDREWAVADERERMGIPIDPDTARFLGF
jgi:ureidoglycolate dehydrogenase (NAD+)